MEDIEQGKEYTRIVSKVTNNFGEPFTAKKGPNAGKTLYKHKIVFTDGYQGVVYQITPALTHNKDAVSTGQSICFTSRPHPTDPKHDPIIELCIDKQNQVTNDEHSEPRQKEIVVSGKPIVFSMGYAKDIVIAAYLGSDKSLDEYVAAIKKVSIELSTHLKENV